MSRNGAWSSTPIGDGVPDDVVTAAQPAGAAPEFEAGPPPASAAAVFGERLGLAHRFAARLATDGVVRGLIGPREVPRLWDRHLLNCAVVAELLPAAARVVDVGSGAGLPGLVLACARPDLRVDLLDPLSRRTVFLIDVVAELGLADQVRVFTGRAESREMRAAVGDSEWVTARAVAPLGRLAAWCLPLLRPGGTLLAIRGARAADELREHRRAVHAQGGRVGTIQQCGVGLLDPPVRVLTVIRR